jgi:5'-3' exonuclease
MTGSCFLAVDGTGLLVRCCRAPRSRDLFASDGTPTGALMMFVASLSRTVKIIRPTRLLVAWDGADCLEWRREICPSYKAGSKGFDIDSLEAAQAVEFLATAGIPQCRIAGFEADDILAAVTRACPPGLPFVLASEDADMLQLVGGTDRRVFRGYAFWDSIDVLREWGATHSHLTMLRALAGDRSDGIAGVPQVGLVRALRMLKAGNFAWPLPPEVLPRREHRAVADACYRVMDLINPVRRPEESALFGNDVINWAWNPPDHAKVLPLLDRYELSAIAERSRTGNLW